MRGQNQLSFHTVNGTKVSGHDNITQYGRCSGLRRGNDTLIHVFPSGQPFIRNSLFQHFEVILIFAVLENILASGSFLLLRIYEYFHLPGPPITFLEKSKYDFLMLNLATFQDKYIFKMTEKQNYFCT